MHIFLQENQNYKMEKYFSFGTAERDWYDSPQGSTACSYETEFGSCPEVHRELGKHAQVNKFPLVP